MGRIWKSFEVQARKIQDCGEGGVDRHMNAKGHSDEISEREKNWRESFHLLRQ